LKSVLQFQRRRVKCEKLTDGRTLTHDKSSHGLWPGELKISQSERRIAYGGHVCKRIGTKWAILIDDLPRMLPTKFRFIWQSSFRDDNFLEINQSETRIVCGGHVCKRIGNKWAVLIEDLPRMLPTKFRFIWPSGFRGFRNQPIRNKNCLWRPCLSTGRDEMSNLYRGPAN
jgi:uncharacterized protein YbaR (Trm112 family)